MYEFAKLFFNISTEYLKKVHTFVFHSAASGLQLSVSPLGFARGDLLTVLTLSGWDCTHVVSLSLSHISTPLSASVRLEMQLSPFSKNVWADWWVINSSSVPWRLRAALKVIGRGWLRREECYCVFIISYSLLVVIYYWISPLRKSFKTPERIEWWRQRVCCILNQLGPGVSLSIYFMLSFTLWPEESVVSKNHQYLKSMADYFSP